MRKNSFKLQGNAGIGLLAKVTRGLTVHTGVSVTAYVASEDYLWRALQIHYYDKDTAWVDLAQTAARPPNSSLRRKAISHALMYAVDSRCDW